MAPATVSTIPKMASNTSKNKWATAVTGSLNTFAKNSAKDAITFHNAANTLYPIAYRKPKISPTPPPISCIPKPNCWAATKAPAKATANSRMGQCAAAQAMPDSMALPTLAAPAMMDSALTIAKASPIPARIGRIKSRLSITNIAPWPTIDRASTPTRAKVENRAIILPKTRCPSALLIKSFHDAAFSCKLCCTSF